MASEEAAGRYSRAFEPFELEALIGPFRTSPLGLVPKPGTSKVRLIQDFSYPRNSSLIKSVNSHINADHFPTEWGTFDKVSSLILSLPDKSEAATFDISSAYRIAPVLPSQQNALCIAWRGKVRVDRAVSFGLASSCGVFGAVADMLVALYHAGGFPLLLKWVDDFILFRRPGETFTEEDFIRFTGRLGVPWGLDKTRDFATRQKYIGFIWDLVQRSVSLPPEKLAAVLQLISEWLEEGARFSAHDAARLHGKLVHASSIFPLIRPFLRSISRFAAHFTSAHAHHAAPGPLRADLSWIQELLQSLPAELPLARPEPFDIGWWGDASTSFGIGVVVGTFWAVWRWQPDFRVGGGQEFDIGWAEAVAVELGLLMAIHHGLIQSRPIHSPRILVRSDNMGVVEVLNRGRSRSANTNNVLKRIYLHLAHHGISLCTQHVPSRDNVTDALSRGDIHGFLSAFPVASTRSDLETPSHLRKCIIS